MKGDIEKELNAANLLLQARNDLIDKQSKQIKDLEYKAKKLDKLVAIVERFYIDDNGDPIESDAGLDEIGEAVATELGYL